MTSAGIEQGADDDEIGVAHQHVEIDDASAKVSELDAVGVRIRGQ